MSTPQQVVNNKKPSRLGRGLSSLMAQAVPVAVKAEVTPAVSQPGTPFHVKPASTEPLAGDAPVPASAQASPLQDLPIAAIVPNPRQPRQHFDPAALEGLAQSIRLEGVMQPVIVRPASGHASTTSAASYELVAGERRWRAAQLAGLTNIPALVRQLTDQQVAEWALVENLQREDLNPIERAEAFARLLEQHQLSQEQIAQRLGLDRSTVSNTLRLLQLPQEVRSLIVQGQLTAGQARPLAGLEDPLLQIQLAQQAVRMGWSARQMEAAVKTRESAGAAPATATPTPQPRGAHLRDLEVQIGEQLKTKVALRAGRKKGTGTLSIDFYSLDHFEQLVTKLGVRLD